jgi:hypothetical protein
MPVHRVFYGVISLVVSVYSLIGVNLGGFFIGMLLGSVGGVMVVAWMPKMAATDSGSRAGSDPESQPEQPKPKPRPQPQPQPDQSGSEPSGSEQSRPELSLPSARRQA